MNISDKVSVVVWLAIVLLTPVPVAAEKGSMAIADFGTTVQTDQGGFFRCFGGRPDQIADRLTSLGEPESDTWRISLAGNAPASGVGVLIPLFDETGATNSVPLRIRNGQNLTLRLLGELGNRRLRIEVVPTKNPEAAGTTIGVVESGQLDAHQWRDIRLPLLRDQRGAKQASFIRILADGQGTAWFAIESLALLQNGESLAQPSPASRSVRPLRKALWVWKRDKILSEPKQVETLIELCSQHGITDLFFNVPYSHENGVVHLQMVKPLRALNATAHTRDIKVHVLDGGRDYVLRANHAQMIGLVDAVGEFNQSVAPNTRFAAIHLDNEPYLLPGWNDDSQRRQIIREYIELYQKLRPRADALGLELGVDIPFWWDERDREGQPKFTYDTEAGKQPLLEALFPLMRNIGIMSYRRRVIGPNGVVFHCLNEFALGEKHDVDVFASMELGTGNDVEAGTSFGAYGWPYFHGQLDMLERILPNTPGASGIAIHYYEPFAEAMK